MADTLNLVSDLRAARRLTLTDLHARIQSGSGADRELDAEIVRVLCPGATVGHYITDDAGDVVFHAEAIGIANKRTCPAFTTSPDGIGACLTLAGKVLPGWSTNMRIVSQEGRWFCTFTHGRERLWGDRSAPNSGPDTCRAILSAILAALIDALETLAESHPFIRGYFARATGGADLAGIIGVLASPAPPAVEPPTGFDAAVSDEMVEAAEAAIYGRHERGFVMGPLIDRPDMRAALEAALRTLPSREATDEEVAVAANILSHWGMTSGYRTAARTVLNTVLARRAQPAKAQGDDQL